MTTGQNYPSINANIKFLRLLLKIKTMKPEPKSPELENLNRVLDIINENNSFDFGDSHLLFDHWIYSKLPDPIKDLFQLIDKPRKRDITLLTVLTIFGAIIKNFESQHGETLIGTQLYFYLLGNPGHDKSVATNLKSLGAPYHRFFLRRYEREQQEYNSLMEKDKGFKAPSPKRRFLYVPGDITKAALVNQIKDNNGYGFIFLSEADTLTGAIYNQYGDFKDMLRIGFDGHPYSVSRAKSETGTIEINNLNLSVVLTSTINQSFKLIPTSEDGLFSRFLFYVLRPNYEFDNVFEKKDPTKFEGAKQKIANTFLAMGVRSEKGEKKIFEFTKPQSDELFFMFSDVKDAVGENQHINLLGNINRMAIMIRKIAMALSYLRAWSDKGGKVPHKITCRQQDFKIAKSMVTTLVIHLLAVEHLYQNNNYTHRKLAHIPSNSDLEAGDKNKNVNEKFRAISLRRQGLTYREISKIIFGDDNHPGTIKKWVDAANKKPFPETETPYNKKHRRQ